MRTVIVALLVAASAVAQPACSSAPPAHPGVPGTADRTDSLHLRVLAIHDFHGTLRPLRPAWAEGRAVGGAAALKAHMDSAASRCPCPVIRLDGGDQMQGSLDSSLSHGAAVVATFNAIGIDAAAIGNHDLGWGVDTLRARQAEARYAWLAANVFMRGSDERPRWAKPYVILDRGGVRVAVIGYATTETPATLRPATTAPYEFRRAIDGVRAALAEVREHAPDFTVIVAHARGDCSSGACEGEMVELAQSLDPDEVQLIAGGHEHAAAEVIVNGIPIVRASSHSRAMSVVDLFRTASGERHFRLARDTLYVDAVEPDRGVEELIGPYVARADSAAGAPIAVMSQQLAPRSTEHLGNLITDAMRLAAGTDIALSNVGGIRAGLPAGAITYNDAHRVLPFDNVLVRLHVSGEQLRQIAEVAVRQGAPDDFSGVTVHYDPDLPSGSRVLSMILDNGSVVVDAGEYSLVVPSYIAEGGGGYGLVEELPAVHIDMPMLDAFIEHLQRLPQPVVAPGEPRAVARRAGTGGVPSPPRDGDGGERAGRHARGRVCS